MELKTSDDQMVNNDDYEHTAKHEEYVMKQIVVRMLKRGDGMHILDVDCGDFKHREVSKDQKYIKSVFDAVNIIKLGLENS